MCTSNPKTTREDRPPRGLISTDSELNLRYERAVDLIVGRNYEDGNTEALI